MYVLHHADQPELYSDLPKEPQVSPMVRVWKGAAKPFGLAVIGLTALAGFFHYICVGPSESDERDEAAAKNMARKQEKTP
jgi:formate dehydrogenase iron-sulfur subunit